MKGATKIEIVQQEFDGGNSCHENRECSREFFLSFSPV